MRPASVDPECAAALAALPDWPPVSAETLADLRADPGLPTNDELSRGGMFRVEQRAAPGPPGDPAVSLLCCLPTQSTGSAPALFFVHGGGMVLGSPRDALAQVLDLAAPLGAAVVSVDYRLAPETPHPGPVEDCYAALMWLLQTAEDIGVDARRVVLLGASSGGGLAAAVTLLARDRGAATAAGQLLMSPMLDDRNDSPSVQQLAQAKMWKRSDNEFGWTALLGDQRGGPDVSPYAAPAREDDLGRLPPAFLDVGSADLFRDETVAYARALWLAGGDAELHVWPGAFHGFDVVAPQASVSRAAVAARAEWLHRLLDL